MQVTGIGYQFLVVHHAYARCSPKTQPAKVLQRETRQEKTCFNCTTGVTLCSAGQGRKKFLFHVKDNPTGTEMFFKQGEELSCNSAWHFTGDDTKKNKTPQERNSHDTSFKEAKKNHWSGYSTSTPGGLTGSAHPEQGLFPPRADRSLFPGATGPPRARRPRGGRQDASCAATSAVACFLRY